MSVKHLSRRAVLAAAAALAIAAPVAGAHFDPATPTAGPANDAGYADQGTHYRVPPAREASIRDLPPKLRSLARAEQGATAAYRADAGTPAVQRQPSTSGTSSGFDWAIAALAAGVLAGVVALVSLGTVRGRRHRAQTVGGERGRPQHQPQAPEGEAVNHHRTRVLVARGLALVAVLAATPLVVVPALATPPSGVSNPPWSPVIGRFNDINVSARTDTDPGPRTHFWKARVKTKGATDVHIVENVIHPGGTFGWHSHPGPSFVTVKSGVLSVYHAPECIPQQFGPAAALGSTFIDEGHDLHMVRNNGTGDADVYVISFVPAGFNRRIDEPNPNPSACPD